MRKSETDQVQSMFRKEFSRLFTLLPDLKIGMTIAIVPLSSADDPVLVKNRNSPSAEEVWKQLTIKQVIAPPCRADAASIYLRTERGQFARVGKGHENGQGSKQGSDARSRFTGCKENSGLRGTFALQREVLSWVVSQLDMFLSHPGKNSVYALQMRLSPCSDSSPPALVKLPLVSTCACGILTSPYKILKSKQVALFHPGSF
ncbi:uncharacterized protein LOC118010338 [Mirounga leonina]|uniref:uncharacterized protein LOC118010338 n=1 Tax=Mirounga leonina TaxID=9715 RepID=UPI00156C2879|nr:uncharacterized protein LOC118010338 [Mirounga leonina]